jgi:hypothetical protein
MRIFRKKIFQKKISKKFFSGKNFENFFENFLLRVEKKFCEGFFKHLCDVFSEFFEVRFVHLSIRFCANNGSSHEVKGVNDEEKGQIEENNVGEIDSLYPLGGFFVGMNSLVGFNHDNSETDQSHQHELFVDHLHHSIV